MAYQPASTTDTVIDVSHWQGKNIDWAKVSAAGKTVAMIKATQGTSTDDTWHINRIGAAANSIFVIPYMYVTQEEPQVQINYFSAVTGLAEKMPFAIDWEGGSAPTAGLMEAVGLGLSAISGRDPLGYWGLSPPGDPTQAMKSWPRWIPRYGVNDGQPDPRHPVSEPWLFWQYTSAARVDGVQGNVDASLFAGTQGELITWCQTGALPG